MHKKIIKISRIVEEEYGRPRRFARTDAVDELVRTILSQNTNDRNSLAAFAILKRSFKTWNAALETPTRRIASLIKHAGLANIKAKRIKEALVEIKAREGSISLSILKDLSVPDGLEYLKSLKGVGPKTAACVLLFSFGKAVMPVDTHIFRVTKRLGLIDKALNIEEAHKVLSGLVPKHLIYRFHLGIIEHGRRTCKAQNPRCGFCVLYELCLFKDKKRYTKVGRV